MKRLSNAISRLQHFVFGDEGSTLAEMAIMVPFLAVMLAGVSEFGRMFQAYNTATKSTRVAARYLSNHPFNDTEKARTKNLVVCGKLEACTAGEEVLPGLTTANVCIESVGTPVPSQVTVRIPETADGCADPYVYQPIFDLGKLLQTQTFSLAVPIHSSTTMYFMLDH